MKPSSLRARAPYALGFALALALGGCGKSGATLDVKLYTPDDTEQKPFDGVRLLRALVSAPGLSRTPQYFDVAAGVGTISELPLSRFVTITIEGLAGVDAEPLARGYVPPVDLLAGVTAAQPMFFGQIDRFASNVAVADSHRAELSEQRVGHTSTLLKDGRVLVAGGANLSAQGSVVSLLASVELYDPATATSRTVTPMGFARAFHTATLLKDGRVLIAGGLSLITGSVSPVATAEIFDPSSGTFRNAAGLPERRGRVSHTATLLPDGRVLLAGGYGDSGNGQRVPLDTAEVFDPTTGRYSDAAQMRIGRVNHTATPLFDGRVLLVGGRNLNGALGSTELFDPSHIAFSDGPSLPGNPRAGHSAIRLGSGYVLVIGGCSTPEALNARATAVTGSGCSAVDSSPSPAGSSLNRVDLFDPGNPADGASPPRFYEGTVPALQLSRADAAVTLLPGDNRVLVVGGTAQDGTTTSLAEVIEESPGPSYTRRRVAGEMRFARTLHTVTRLASGLILIGGGSGRSAPSYNYSVLSNLELYVP